MDFFHLVDFQVQINQTHKMIDKKIKNFIVKNASLHSDEEVCGFIVKDNDDFKCIPCQNIAESKKDNFKINSKEYLNIKKSYKIYYIYHSHINDNIDFSDKDKFCAENLNLPIILYHLKTNTFKIYEPIDFVQEYVGNYFQLGKYDCFTLIEKYLKKELNINIEYNKNFKNLFEANKLIDEYSKNNFSKKYGFIEIKNLNDMKKNDILIMNSNTGKHFAIYIEKDRILHQPMFGFSKIENYCNFYKRHTEACYRINI
jgi:proteasome lid subunit RPN8/RPN11